MDSTGFAEEPISKMPFQHLLPDDGGPGSNCFGKKEKSTNPVETCRNMCMGTRGPGAAGI